MNSLQMTRPPEQIAAAEKTFAMLAQSTYKDKMGSAGFFLVRLQSLAESAPALDEQKLDQIAALPLGSRIRLDPWTNHISLLQAKPVSLLSARDKLPFEITPFMLPLARVEPQPPPSR